MSAIETHIIAHTPDLATNELRQVRYEQWIHDQLVVFYKTQRLWHIMESPYRYLRAEWRDLPEIKEADLLTPATPSTTK